MEVSKKLCRGSGGHLCGEDRIGKNISVNSFPQNGDATMDAEAA